MTKSNSSDRLIGHSWEIWDFLTKKAGLDTEGYDEHIIAELCNQLNIRIPCRSIRAELKGRKISSELFINAFLKAVQPYAQMMTDLCVFFYWHGIKKTNQELKIFFDFGKGPEDLGFDLRHFREILLKYKRVIQSLSVYGWNHNTLWSLENIFRNYRGNIIQDPVASQWLSRYDNSGEFGYPYPILPTTEIEEIDVWMQRVWNVWMTIISECRKYGDSRKDLRCNAEIKRDDTHDMDIEDQKESYDSIKRFQELPDFEEWDVWTIFILDNDRWPESTLIGIFSFVEYLRTISKDKRLEEASETLHQIQHLYSSLPHRKMKNEVLEKEILELLNLPIWSRRHELYQTWVLSQIDKALKSYQREIHQINGSLIFSFSGTHIGAIETEKGRIHIWGELRSPLANPIGKGRKRHIQPDYSLTFEPITEPSQTVLAIECKQYKRAGVKNFSEALIDYAKGRIKANVLLVNYGAIPQKITDQIDSNFKARAYTIGNFIPGNSKATDKFCQILLESLPNATSGSTTIDSPNETKYDLIVVDVSGSMENFLSQERILNVIRMIMILSPQAKLLAVNTSIVRKWELAEKGYNEIFHLPKKGGTDLHNALSSCNLDNAVIFTDSDGWSQMFKMASLPKLVVEIGTEKNLIFHFSD